MKISHILLAILVMAIWGFNFVIIEIGLRDMPPLVFCFLRFFLASFPALFFIERPKAPILLVALFGIVMFALQFSLLFIGMHLGVTAGLASLLLQVQVFFTIFLAAIFLKEKVFSWQIVGALVAFIGIGIVGYNLEGTISLSGFIFVMLAAISWAVGNLIAKQCKEANMLSLVIWGSFFAWPFVFVVALFFEGKMVFYDLMHLSWSAIAVLLYIAYPTTILGFAAWSWLLTRYRAATVTPFALLVPIFGILSSVLVLGEPLLLWKIIAACLIVSGLFICIWVKS